MKRLIALLLCFCVLPAASLASSFSIEAVEPTDAERLLTGYNAKTHQYVYIAFGRYPFEADGSAAPCVWRVLSTADGFAFLLEEWVIDYCIFHPEKKDQDEWRDYQLFTTMNTEMVDRMFTPEEKRAVRYTDELGWLFILDNKEFMTAEYGFRSILTRAQKERECPPTPYAKATGKGYIDKNKMTWYWSRSCRHTAAGGYEHIIGYDGHISMHAFDQFGGVRPACYVDMTRLDHVSGSGTENDPYVFELINP